MSNIIQIKRGKGVPPKGSLMPYELGYDTEGDSLYIGLENGELGLGIKSNKKEPRTTLMKNKSSKAEAQILQIYCQNLQPGTEYTLCLYTLQKSGGNSYRYWRHPNNVITTKEVDGEQVIETGKFTGYANIANTRITKDSVEVHLPVQTWMLRQGVLQTEWVFTPEEENYLLNINLNDWILDLLKCDIKNQRWVLMGLPNKKQSDCTRLFQFRLKESGKDTIYETNNFLVLGDVTREISDNSITKIGYFSIKN